MTSVHFLGTRLYYFVIFFLCWQICFEFGFVYFIIFSASSFSLSLLLPLVLLLLALSPFSASGPAQLMVDKVTFDLAAEIWDISHPSRTERECVRFIDFSRQPSLNVQCFALHTCDVQLLNV